MAEYKQGLEADRARRLGLVSDKKESKKRKKESSKEKKRRSTKSGNKVRIYIYSTGRRYAVFFGLCHIAISFIIRFATQGTITWNGT